MAGLQTYVRRIPAGAISKIAARGHRVIVRDCRGPLNISVIANQTGRKTGQQYSLTMRNAERWFNPEEFDEVVISHSLDVEQEVTLLIGEGEFERDPPNPSTATSIKSTCWSYVHRVIQAEQVSFWVRLLGENPQRKRYRVFLCHDAGTSSPSTMFRAAIFGRDTEAHRYSHAFLSLAWPASATAVVPGTMLASNFLPSSLRSYTETSTPIIGRPLATAGSPDVWNGGISDFIYSNQTRIKVTVNDSARIQLYSSHFLIRDPINLTWYRYNMADASVFSATQLSWPIGNLPRYQSLTYHYPVLICDEGEIPFSGTYPQLGIQLMAPNGRQGEWSDWIESTDEVNVLVSAGNAAVVTHLIAQEETYD